MTIPSVMATINVSRSSVVIKATPRELLPRMGRGESLEIGIVGVMRFVAFLKWPATNLCLFVMAILLAIIHCQVARINDHGSGLDLIRASVESIAVAVRGVRIRRSAPNHFNLNRSNQ